MRSRLAAFLGAVLVSLFCVQSAHAEAILTVGGLSLVPDENGMIQLNVDVDLAGSAPNLVSFELDVLYAGLTYVSHTISLDGDGDPATIEYFDGTSAYPDDTGQIVMAILDAGVGPTVGRLFSMNFLVTDRDAASLSLRGFPVAQDFEGLPRSESLLSEVAPLDFQPVPFAILLSSNGIGELTMTLGAPVTDPPPPDPGGPVPVSEPGTLLLFGLGLIAASVKYGRSAHRRTTTA